MTGFVAGGIIDFGGFNLNPASSVVLPLGAVFFGLFMIWNMMAKEMTAFDAEKAVKPQSADRPAIALAAHENPVMRPGGLQLEGNAE